MQPPRLLGIRTTLKGDPLTLTRLSVTEEVGLPYAIEAEVLGTDVELQAKDLMGKEVTCSVAQHAGGSEIVRHYHGVVAQFERLGPGIAGRMAYRLVAVPELWRLGLTRDRRIFQEKNLAEIVGTVLDDGGVKGKRMWGITDCGDDPIPYCTQFNESDLAFLSRLLEEHGATYYFRQGDGEHELLISGTENGFPKSAVASVKALHDSENFTDLTAWRRTNRSRPGEVALHDMDKERSDPATSIFVQRTAKSHPGEAAMSANGIWRHWPGGMSTRTYPNFGGLVMGAFETASEGYQAETRDPRHEAGRRVKVAVQNEDGSETEREYIITAIRHEAADTSGIVAGAGGVERYMAHLSLVAADRPWMPQPRHPRPVMSGLCSAIVTGPKDEQIHTDALGRVKVLFLWDHTGKKDDSSSCWVRVMQPAAGAWGGTWFLPRVGDEVIVAFLEGDPDRPIVVGSAYGKEAPPPFDPKANKSQSGYRTRSYKSKSKEDANILRFEDKKDSEEILLHAQKDLTVEVEQSELRKIGTSRTTTVTGDKLGGKNAETYTLKDGNRTETIEKGDDTYSLDTGNRSHTIKTGNDELAIKAGNLSTKLDKGNEDRKLAMGNFTLKCDLGAVTIEAMKSITLKVGQNSVTIDQAGVTIAGLTVKVEGKAMLETKAPMSQHKGDGMMMISGGIVMIN